MHRAEEAMAEAIERLRPVAKIPGYHGLDIAYVEQVASLVGRTRAAIANGGSKWPPAAALHPACGRATRDDAGARIAGNIGQS